MRIDKFLVAATAIAVIITGADIVIWKFTEAAPSFPAPTVSEAPAAPACASWQETLFKARAQGVLVLEFPQNIVAAAVLLYNAAEPKTDYEADAVTLLRVPGAEVV